MGYDLNGMPQAMAEKEIVVAGRIVLIWNTGRFYSEKGQRIAATKVPRGIVFYDLDRQIDGMVDCLDLDKHCIMNGYDYGTYTYIEQKEEILAKRFLSLPEIEAFFK